MKQINQKFIGAEKQWGDPPDSEYMEIFSAQSFARKNSSFMTLSRNEIDALNYVSEVS